MRTSTPSATTSAAATVDLNLSILAIYVTLLLGLLGAYVKFRGLQLQTHDAWHTRSSLAKAQLDDRSLTAILELQTNVNAALDELSNDSDLEIARIDPARFAADVAVFQRLQAQRQGVDCYYTRMRAVAPWISRSILVSFICFVAAGARQSITWSGWYSWTAPLAWTVLGVGILPILTLGALYLRDRDRLGAAVMAGSGDA